MAWRLFRSSLRARHQRAGLGYLWLVIPALATTGVAAYLHNRGVIAVNATGLPYPAYALTGIVLWQGFTDAVAAPLQQFTAGRSLLTRSRVPQEALVLAGLLDVLLNAMIRGLVLVSAFVVLGVPLGASAGMAPLGVFSLALLGLAIGVLLAPLGLLFDDVGRGITLATSFWFFLTPVVYVVPAEGLLRFNPVTPLLEFTRASLTGGSTPDGFALVTAIAGAVLVVGWLLQRIARPHVIARLG